MSILNVGDALKKDSQSQLHSRLVRCELWFPLYPYFSAASFTGPKVHWEGHLPKSGVPGNNHKCLLPLLPCPAPPLIAVCSSFVCTVLSAVLLQGCVCSLIENEKELETRGQGEGPSPPPWYCPISPQVIHHLGWKEGDQNCPQKPWN